MRFRPASGSREMIDAQGTYEEFASRLAGQRCTGLWRYWLSKRAGRFAPEWHDIDLMDIYEIAPYLTILDVDDGTSPPVLTYRYVGTHIVMSRWKMNVTDPTGRNFGEIEHQYDFGDVARLYYECIAAISPRHMRSKYDALDAHGMKERLVLPVISPSGKIDKILSLRERLTDTAVDQPVTSLAPIRATRH